MNQRPKPDIVKGFLSDPSIYTLCATQLAIKMSLGNSPFRGAGSSDNKAFLAINILRQLKSKIETLDASHPEHIESVNEVKALYESFVRRTLDQGEECIYDESDGDHYDMEDYRASFAGIRSNARDDTYGEDDSLADSELESEEDDMSFDLE